MTSAAGDVGAYVPPFVRLHGERRGPSWSPPAEPIATSRRAFAASPRCARERQAPDGWQRDVAHGAARARSHAPGSSTENVVCVCPVRPRWRVARIRESWPLLARDAAATAGFRPAVPWTNLWQSPASPSARRVCPHARDGFPRERTRPRRSKVASRFAAWLSLSGWSLSPACHFTFRFAQECMRAAGRSAEARALLDISP